MGGGATGRAASGWHTLDQMEQGGAGGNERGLEGGTPPGVSATSILSNHSQIFERVPISSKSVLSKCSLVRFDAATSSSSSSAATSRPNRTLQLSPNSCDTDGCVAFKVCASFHVVGMSQLASQHAAKWGAIAVSCPFVMPPFPEQVFFHVAANFLAL